MLSYTDKWTIRLLFDENKGIPNQTRTLVNSLGFVPAVESFNTMRSTGMDATGDFDWLSEQIVLHDDLVKNIRTNITFRRPAFFEDELILETTLIKVPSYSIEFEYKIFKDSELINEGYTKLVFLNKKTNKPIRCPKKIIDAIIN